METRDSIGGAMYFEENANVKLINTELSENSAYMKGGGAFLKKV